MNKKKIKELLRKYGELHDDDLPTDEKLEDEENQKNT